MDVHSYIKRMEDAVRKANAAMSTLLKENEILKEKLAIAEGQCLVNKTKKSVDTNMFSKNHESFPSSLSPRLHSESSPVTSNDPDRVGEPEPTTEEALDEALDDLFSNSDDESDDNQFPCDDTADKNTLKELNNNAPQTDFSDIDEALDMLSDDENDDSELDMNRFDNVSSSSDTARITHPSVGFDDHVGKSIEINPSETAAIISPVVDHDDEHTTQDSDEKISLPNDFFTALHSNTYSKPNHSYQNVKIVNANFMKKKHTKSLSNLLYKEVRFSLISKHLLKRVTSVAHIVCGVKHNNSRILYKNVIRCWEHELRNVDNLMSGTGLKKACDAFVEVYLPDMLTIPLDPSVNEQDEDAYIPIMSTMSVLQLVFKHIICKKTNIMPLNCGVALGSVSHAAGVVYICNKLMVALHCRVIASLRHRKPLHMWRLLCAQTEANLVEDTKTHAMQLNMISWYGDIQQVYFVLFSAFDLGLVEIVIGTMQHLLLLSEGYMKDLTCISGIFVGITLFLYKHVYEVVCGDDRGSETTSTYSARKTRSKCQSNGHQIMPTRKFLIAVAFSMTKLMTLMGACIDSFMSYDRDVHRQSSTPNIAINQLEMESELVLSTLKCSVSLLKVIRAHSPIVKCLNEVIHLASEMDEVSKDIMLSPRHDHQDGIENNLGILLLEKVFLNADDKLTGYILNQSLMHHCRKVGAWSYLRLPLNPGENSAITAMNKPNSNNKGSLCELLFSNICVNGVSRFVDSMLLLSECVSPGLKRGHLSINSNSIVTQYLEGIKKFSTWNRAVEIIVQHYNETSAAAAIPPAVPTVWSVERAILGHLKLSWDEFLSNIGNRNEDSNGVDAGFKCLKAVATSIDTLRHYFASILVEFDGSSGMKKSSADQHTSGWYVGEAGNDAETIRFSLSRRLNGAKLRLQALIAALNEILSTDPLLSENEACAEYMGTLSNMAGNIAHLQNSKYSLTIQQQLEMSLPYLTTSLEMEVPSILYDGVESVDLDSISSDASQTHALLAQTLILLDIWKDMHSHEHSPLMELLKRDIVEREPSSSSIDPVAPTYLHVELSSSDGKENAEKDTNIESEELEEVAATMGSNKIKTLADEYKSLSYICTDMISLISAANVEMLVYTTVCSMRSLISVLSDVTLEVMPCRSSDIGQGNVTDGNSLTLKYKGNRISQSACDYFNYRMACHSAIRFLLCAPLPWGTGNSNGTVIREVCLLCDHLQELSVLFSKYKPPRTPAPVPNADPVVVPDSTETPSITVGTSSGSKLNHLSHGTWLSTTESVKRKLGQKKAHESSDAGNGATKKQRTLNTNHAGTTNTTSLKDTTPVIDLVGGDNLHLPTDIVQWLYNIRSAELLNVNFCTGHPRNIQYFNASGSGNNAGLMSSHSNFHKIPVIVLNLDRRYDRWLRILRQFECNGLIAIRISAMDSVVIAKKLVLEKELDMGITNNSLKSIVTETWDSHLNAKFDLGCVKSTALTMTLSERCCVRSHVYAWELIASIGKHLKLCDVHTLGSNEDEDSVGAYEYNHVFNTKPLWHLWRAMLLYGGWPLYRYYVAASTSNNVNTTATRKSKKSSKKDELCNITPVNPICYQINYLDVLRHYTLSSIPTTATSASKSEKNNNHTNSLRIQSNTIVDWYVIFEDDASITKSNPMQCELASIIPNIIQRLPYDWDICYLGYIIPKVAIPQARVVDSHAHGSYKQGAAHKSSGGPGVLIEIPYAWQLHAYIIRSSTAVKLISNPDPINMPVDNYIASMLYKDSMKGYGIKPSLVKQSNKKAVPVSLSERHCTNMIALYDSKNDLVHMYNNANNQSNIMHSGKSHGYETKYA